MNKQETQALAMLKQVAEGIKSWPFRLWGFGEGIALRGLLSAYRVTGEDRYCSFVVALLEKYLSQGVGKFNAEHVAPGTELLLVYEACGRPEFLEAAKALAELNASFSKNKFGARMHRPDLSGWRKQIWVDCMDVDAPFLLRLAQLTGQEHYLEQGLDEILGYARALQIESDGETTGLFWHGYEVDCGNNGQVWARGNGWALMGLVETLKLLPDTHPSRPELMERLQRICLALKQCQHAGGLWHTVLNKSDTYLESTLAVMTAFALREAFAGGLLEESEFSEMEQKARSSALECVNGNGELNLVSDATPVAELKMYASRPFGIYPWGQGPLLLMLAQVVL